MSDQPMKLQASFRLSREMEDGNDNPETNTWFSVSSEEPCLQAIYRKCGGAEKRELVRMVLSHAPEAVNMARISNGIALRDGHGGDQVAMLTPPVLRNGKLGGEKIVWSASERAEVLRKDYEAGVRWEASVEADYSDAALVATGEQIGGVPVVRCDSWTPYAAALAIVQPADTTVGFSRSAADAIAPVQGDEKQEQQADEKPIEAPAVIRSTTMSDQTIDRAACFKQVAEVHTIARDFNVPQDVTEGWLSKLEKGETDIASIQRETLSKYAKRGEIAAKAIAADPAVARSVKSLTPGDAPAELAEKFSIRRAIISSLPEAEAKKFGLDKVDVGLERETQQELLRLMRQVPGYESFTPRGPMIPWNARVNREIGVQSAGVAASVVASNLRPDLFIDVLRAKLVLAQAGMTVLSGLVGDVKIPRKTAACTAGWTNGEVAVGNSEFTLGQLTLTPKTVGAYSDMSRQALLQSTPAIDMLVMNDLMDSTARAIQSGALHGTNATGQPLGVAKMVTDDSNTFTVSSAGTPTFAELLAAESKLGTNNVEDDGTVAWITTPAVFNKLRSLPRVASTGDSFLATKRGAEMTIIDSPAFTTTSVVTHAAFYGRWSDLVMGAWNAFELIVDPYSLSTKGALRIVGLQSVDFTQRFEKAFTYQAAVNA